MNHARWLLIASLAGMLACSSAAPGADGGALDAGPLDSGSDAGMLEGAPLGATWNDGGSLTFAVASEHATRIEVWVYAQPRGAEPVAHLPLTRTPDSDEWTATIDSIALAADSLAAPVYYGFRAWGPNWTFDPAWTPGSAAGFVAEVDSAGNRFNPNKLLIDPYARELSHDPWQPQMPDGSVYGDTGTDRNKDSGPSASKSIALAPEVFDTGAKPGRPLAEQVIYEVHLKGFTRNDPSISRCAGTFQAAATRAGYLHDLGVTAIELLPVQETANDTNTESSPGNYWGYSTLAFLAPDRRYACDQSPGGPTRELAAMVKAFHDAGIKVFLDVVYNHTAETGAHAMLSLRGLDSASYYELSADGQGYVDNTGLGGNINAASPLVRDLVLASLHHFADDLGIDGFRFDLAAVLGNRCDAGCFDFEPDDPGNILQRAVAELPGEALIAEPWGIGDGTYQLANFPKGWSAWNDRFRDSVRTAQNKLGVVAQPMRALQSDLDGSPGLFDTGGRAPTASVNAVVTHDGFTLNDVFACNEAQDDHAWPYGPSSGGSSNNLSWDQGGVRADQEQAARTAMALLGSSAGVPMLTGGDEFLRSQHCNNNAYNLDSVGNWLDWASAPDEAAFTTFVSRLLAFRAAHPALRPAAFRTGTDHDGNGLPDEAWLTATGAAASSAYLDDPDQHFLGLWLDAGESGDPASSIYLAYQQDYLPLTVQLPPPHAGQAWYRVADTSNNVPAGENFAAAGDEVALGGTTYAMQGRSVAIFIQR